MDELTPKINLGLLIPRLRAFILNLMALTSVFGAEEQIKSHGNHIVYGRRGAGKSSLLAYFMHRQEKKPYVWVAMQTYNGREDRTFLKISGIEPFVKEKPYNAQEIRLDYNLTMPEKSKNHIKSILDAYAIYCALPDISYLCGKGVLDRLVSFTFPEKWEVIKYDDSHFFRNHIDKCQGTKGVDILALSENRLFLIEIKDFRGYRIENKQRLKSGELVTEVTQKVITTPPVYMLLVVGKPKNLRIFIIIYMPNQNVPC